MVVNSFNIEFGYELISCVPYAYWLHVNGKLEETISGVDTESIYYFSPKHTINKENRSWYRTATCEQSGIPNVRIHRHELDTDKFLPPPYKEIYANDEYKFDKPTICICNRYNVEWSTAPINFFSLECLDNMFNSLKEKYQIVYFAVDLPAELEDNAHSKSLGDLDFCKNNHPEVIIFNELRNGKSWNETMMKVFANCERYITMNGGYSIMASYFGGTNIIYSKPGQPQCREIELKSFYRWYPEFGNQRTVFVESYIKLYDKIKQLYVDELPCVNILIRTSGRPRFFQNCYASIIEQTYPNINIVINADSDDGKVYTRKCNSRLTTFKKRLDIPEQPRGKDIGVYFPQNEYLDKMQRLVDGWIIMLDDDDFFIDKNAIEKLSKYMDDKNNFLVWRVDFHDKKIPSDKNWKNKKIEVCDISGIGFAYHSSNINLSDWSCWKRADFRTAKKLHENLDTVWFNEIFTGVQFSAGYGQRKDLPNLDRHVFVEIVDIDGRVINQIFESCEWGDVKLTLDKAGWSYKITKEKLIT